MHEEWETVLTEEQKSKFNHSVNELGVDELGYDY